MLQLTKETIPLLSFIKSDLSFSRVLIKIADIVQLSSSNQVKIRVSIDSGEDFIEMIKTSVKITLDKL